MILESHFLRFMNQNIGEKKLIQRQICFIADLCKFTEYITTLFSLVQSKRCNHLTTVKMRLWLWKDRKREAGLY